MRAILDGLRRGFSGSEGLPSSGWTLALLFGLLTFPYWSQLEIYVVRDTLATHRPLKAFGAMSLKQGEIPVLNPTWAQGQPFAGNPNALPFYPSNLFYLVFSFETAFHLHLLLHTLLAFWGLERLLLQLGAAPSGSRLGAVTYAGCGYFLSAWSFYNLIAVVAWAPWVLWGLARGGRRGILLGGLACGWMLLGGEPVTAVLMIPLFVLVATASRGWRKGMVRAAVVGSLGLLVALPQLVATWAVLEESMRAGGSDPRLSQLQALHPARILELFLPFPFGVPTKFGLEGMWSKRVTPEVPYIFTLYSGVLAPVALLAIRGRALRWVTVAVAGLGAAILAGVFPGLLEHWTGGMFRYPQKFLVWYSVGISMALGLGFQELLHRHHARSLLFRLGLGLGLLALASWVGRSALASGLEALLGSGGPGKLAFQLPRWSFGLALGAVLLGIASWALTPRRQELLVLVQAASLLQLAPLLAGDAARWYEETPPLARKLGERRSVFVASWMVAPWEPRRVYRQELAHAAGLARLTYLDLEPWSGVKLGLRYPLAPDLEGIYSRRWYGLGEAIRLLDWSGRVPWFRRLGVEAVVRSLGEPVEGLTSLAVEEHFGVPTELLAVENPLPKARWPERLIVSTDLESSVRAVASRALGEETVFVPRPLPHQAGGKVKLLEERSDRLVFAVESGGGLVVLQRAFWSFYRARREGEAGELETIPADFALLGVIVPPGRHRVEVIAEVGGLRSAAWAACLVAVSLAVGGIVRERRG